MTISQQTLRKERSLSVYFMTYFVVILIKNFTSHASTSLLIICDKTSGKKRLSLSKIIFLVVETTFRHIFPSGELQCMSHGDIRNLCANTRILLLATHSLMMYDRAASPCEQRGCQSFHWFVFFGEAIKRDTNFFSQDHEAVLGLRSQVSVKVRYSDWKWNLVNFSAQRKRSVNDWWSKNRETKKRR